MLVRSQFDIVRQRYRSNEPDPVLHFASARLKTPASEGPRCQMARSCFERIRRIAGCCWRRVTLLQQEDVSTSVRHFSAHSRPAESRTGLPSPSLQILELDGYGSDDRASRSAQRAYLQNIVQSGVTGGDGRHAANA